MRSRLSRDVHRLLGLLRPKARTGGGRRSESRPAERPAAPAAGNATDVPFGEVDFAYAPEIDGDPDPGEVVWTWVPYEDDPTQGKDRPVVIVGRLHRSAASGAMLAAVALTSRDNDRDDQVPVGIGAWDGQGRPSWAKLDRILGVAAGDVRREGAVLDRDRFDQLVAALGRYHRRGR